MTAKLSVGGYMKYHCSRCDLELGHTIVAMMNGIPIRVRCNTCGSERNYRTKKVLMERPSEPRRLKARTNSDVYQQKLQDSVIKTPRRYQASESFAVGDVVDHPKFGRGIVTKVIPPDRMDILFQDETKTLLCKIDSQ